MDPGDTLSRQTLVLLVDDQESRGAECSRVLQGKGCGVVTAANAEEAQTAFDRRRPDAVLFAPGSASVCGQLHGRDSRRSVPFIVAVSDGDSDAIGRAYVAGASDVVTFPLDYALLVPRIRLFQLTSHLPKGQVKITLHMRRSPSGDQRVETIGFRPSIPFPDTRYLTDPLK